MNKWVDARERMPEVGKPVVVYGKGIFEACGRHRYAITSRGVIPNTAREVWREPSTGFFGDFEITHWMELEEPPKESTDEARS